MHDPNFRPHLNNPRDITMQTDNTMQTKILTLVALLTLCSLPALLLADEDKQSGRVTPAPVNEVLDLLDQEVVFEESSPPFMSEEFDTSQFTRIGLVIDGSGYDISCRLEWQFAADQSFFSVSGVSASVYIGDSAAVVPVSGLQARVYCDSFCDPYMDPDFYMECPPETLTDIKVWLRRE